MAYRIMYDPANPETIQVDNNTGTFYPYKQGGITPKWNENNSTLSLLRVPGDFEPIMPAIPFGSIEISSTGSGGLAAAGSYAALVAFVNAYCFIVPAAVGAGDATAANQVLEIAELTDLNLKLPATIGQKNMAGSLAVTIANNQSTIDVEAQAGENYIGKVGRTINRVDNTPTIDTIAYGAGFCIGGKQTINNAARLAAGTAWLESIQIVDAANVKAEMDIFIFGQDPTGTYNDNAIPNPSATDAGRIMHKITILAANYKNLGGTMAVADTGNIHLDLAGLTGQEIWVVAVVTGTPLYGAANDLTFKFGFEQN